MKKRGSNEQTLKEAIEHLLDAYKLKSGIDKTQLVESWEKVMGKTISKHTEDVKVYDKRMVVRLNSAVLRDELSRGKTKIIQLLNEHAGKEVVDEIILM